MGASLRNVYVASSGQLGAGMAFVDSQNFASNALTFSGLSGDYRYVLYISGSIGAAGYLRIEINGDATVTHYNGELIYGLAAVVGAAAPNSNTLGGCGAAGTAFYNHVVYRTANGYAAYDGVATQLANRQECSGMKTDATITEITSIKIATNDTGVITFTGTAKLYRLSAL